MTGTAETEAGELLGHLQIGRSRDPDQPSDCKKGYERPRLQDETRKV